MKEHVIVLGAGISGLSAAWRLSGRGIEVDVLEAGPSVGGLAGTERQDGCCLDVGPHSFFSEDLKIVETVCGLFPEALQPSSRRVKFFYKGKFMDYPLTAQGVLFQMGLGSGLRASLSFLKDKIFSRGGIPKDEKNETVEGWAISSFGRYLYESFFKPYTEQFWKVPCSELSSRCIPTSTRMNFINTLKLLFDQRTGEKGGSLVEREMCPTYYPETGFSEIAERIAKRIEENHSRIHLGCEATKIEELPHGKMRVFYQRNGQSKRMEGDHVVSTIPLPLMARMFAPSVPEEVLTAADQLEYRSLVVLGMLTEKKHILNCGYVYQLNRLYNRMFEMNEFSPNTSPPGANILAVEMTCSQDSATWSATKEELFDRCIASLDEDGFIGRGDVKQLFLIKAPHAYPVYRKDYATYLNRLMDFFGGKRSLAMLGRCGEFRYMDVDECIKRAFAFVDDKLDRFGPAAFGQKDLTRIEM